MHVYFCVLASPPVLLSCISEMEFSGTFISLHSYVHLAPVLSRRPVRRPTGTLCFLVETSAAVDQYSGARSHAWWKLHASWC